MLIGSTAPLTEASAKSYYGDNTYTDLREGSTYISNINSFSGTLKQRLYIVGNESSPIHWRLASSMERAIATEPWITDEDMRFVNIANTYRTHYHNQNNINATLSIIDYATLNFGGGALHHWRSKQWQRGRDWFDMSESYWANLIGAQSTSVVGGTVESYELICTTLPPPECVALGLDDPENPGRSCQSCTLQLMNVPYYVPVQTGSDGLVAAYSQKAEGTPWTVTSDRIYEAMNVNHMEMRGHTNMTNQLELCFARADFFSTPPW